MVSTLDFESNDPSSNLGGTSFFLFFVIYFTSFSFFFLQLKVLDFHVNQLPMSNTVTGIWTSLVRLAGSGDGAFSSFLTSTAAPNLVTNTLSNKTSSKKLDGKGNLLIA